MNTLTIPGANSDPTGTPRVEHTVAKTIPSLFLCFLSFNQLLIHAGTFPFIPSLLNFLKICEGFFRRPLEIQVDYVNWINTIHIPVDLFREF